MTRRAVYGDTPVAGLLFMYHIVLVRLVSRQQKHHLHRLCSLPLLPLLLSHTRRPIRRNLRKWNRTIPRNVLEKEMYD